MAVVAIMEAMRASRFLADLTTRDRDGRMLLLTVPVGILAAIVAALLGAVAACLAVLVLVSGLDGVPTATALFASFDQPAMAETNARASLFLLAVLAGANGAAALAFVAVAAGLTHRPWRRYIIVEQRFRTRLLIAGLVVVALAMSALILAAAAFGVAPPRPPVLDLAPTAVGRVTYAAFAVVLLVVAAAAEEIVFRGWLLKHTAAFSRNPLWLMAINGLLFAAIHVDPNPDAFLLRMAMGAGLTWMTLRTGGIELAIGAHAANNIVILLLVRPLTLQGDTAHGFQSASLLSALVVVVGYAALAEAVGRWPAMTRWIDGRSDPAPV